MKRVCMRSFSRLFTCALLISGCAAERLHRSGMHQVRNGDVLAGLENLHDAADRAPNNARYHLDYLLERQKYLDTSLEKLSQADAAGNQDVAEKILSSLLQYFPNDTRITQRVTEATRARKVANSLEAARLALTTGDLESAEHFISLIHAEAAGDPRLVTISSELAQARSKLEYRSLELVALDPSKTINLKFVDGSVRTIFDAISRASGLRFIFDKDVASDLRATIDVSDVTPTDAVELLLHTSKLAKKALNSSTALIFSNTQEKADEYRELMIKAFYLNNAEARQTESLLKSLLKAKDVYVDERLNLLVVRDTPEVVRLAEKLVDLQDVSEPEVMLELAVMEVTRTRLTELGIDWPDQISVTPLSSGGEDGGGLTWSDLRSLSPSRIGVSPGSAIVNLRRELTDSDLLANPRIRAKSKEKASVLIGDRVPVLTTTSTSTGFVSENVQYLDVGLKLDVQPIVYLNDEVAIRVGLEVSSLVREIRSATGLLTYQIGTRTASTTLRLRDGETQVLAGLINDEDRSTARRVPGLGDLPLLNRLLGSKQDSRSKTEILLSITPRVLRNIQRPDAYASEFWSGTGTSIRTTPIMLGRPRAVVDKDQHGPAAKLSSQNELDKTASPSLIASSRLAVDATKVDLTWKAPASAKTGETFDVTVQIDTDGDLRAIPFQIAYEPDRVELTSIKEGDFFKDKQYTSSFSSDSDKVGGKVFVSAALDGKGTARGKGVVATLTFKATGTGGGSRLQFVSGSAITGSGSAIEPILGSAATISIE